MLSTYRRDFEKYGVSPSSLGCPKGRQNLRFNAFKNYIKEGSKILDFGCGFGDLAGFLKKENFDVEYIGCDIYDKFLEVAKQNNKEEKFFKLEFGEKIYENFDYILCSGVFNFLYSEKKNTHFEIVKNTIFNLFSHCKIGLIVDFQSQHVDYVEKNSYHQDIQELILYVSKLSRRYIIDHSYLPYEYLINIFKDDKKISKKNIFKN